MGVVLQLYCLFFLFYNFSGTLDVLKSLYNNCCQFLQSPLLYTFFRTAFSGTSVTLLGTSLNFIFIDRCLFSTHTFRFHFLFSIFKFFLQLCPHSNLPPKRNILPILAEKKKFYFRKCRAQMNFVFLVFKQIRWTLKTRCSRSKI